MERIFISTDPDTPIWGWKYYPETGNIVAVFNHPGEYTERQSGYISAEQLLFHEAVKELPQSDGRDKCECCGEERMMYELEKGTEGMHILTLCLDCFYCEAQLPENHMNRLFAGKQS